MPPPRSKNGVTVSQPLNNNKKKRTIRRAVKQRKRVTILSRSQTINKILSHIRLESFNRLKIFETKTHLNPFMTHCGALNTPDYSWTKAKARNKALHKRIDAARKRTSKVQYTTPGPATRVWVPRWPNENPYTPKNSDIPEDRHGKSREEIVRIVQDQAAATKMLFAFVRKSCKVWKELNKKEKKWQMREHASLALRTEGIEVIDWAWGCPGWRMEVYFQEPESWKGTWGLL